MSKYYIQMVDKKLPKSALRRCEIPFEDQRISFVEIDAETIFDARLKAKRENPNLRLDDDSLI